MPASKGVRRLVKVESVEDLARCLTLRTQVEVHDSEGVSSETVTAGVVARFGLNWAPVINGRSWPRHRYRFYVADPK